VRPEAGPAVGVMDLDYELDLSDLAGEVTLRNARHHVDYWTAGSDVVLVEQRIEPGVKYAAWCQVSTQVMQDAKALSAVVDRAIDRWLRPWKYADPCPLPTFDLFPRLSRLARWVRRRG
jgi:hypothetical protein